MYTKNVHVLEEFRKRLSGNLFVTFLLVLISGSSLSSLQLFPLIPISYQEFYEVEVPYEIQEQYIVQVPYIAQIEVIRMEIIMSESLNLKLYTMYSARE